MVLDSIKDSIAHVPQNLASAAKAIASGTADVAGKAANSVGHVAGEVGKGVFSGLGIPLVLGAGVLGVFLLSRRRHRDHDQEETED